MNIKPTIGVIGAGRVGGSLARALHQAGYDIKAVWSRSAEHARALAADVSAAVVESPHEAAIVDLALLAVPDGVIQPLALAIAEMGGWGPGRQVAHLSGTYGAAILADVAATGAQIAALHPLQTFADGRAPLLPGTTFAIEATPTLRETLLALVADLQCVAVEIAPEDRPLYHAAAVMASNYAMTLMAQAAQLLGLCGLERDAALNALLPLVRGAVEGMARRGLPAALTGPIARGDTQTVERHLVALEARAPETASLYALLAGATLPLAAENGLDQQKLDALAATITTTPIIL